MSRADWARWLTTGLAVVAVLAGFLALGELLPGGDELPYLMLAQKLLGNSSFSTQTTTDRPFLDGMTRHELPQLVARAPRAKLHSARSVPRALLLFPDVTARADGDVVASSRFVASVTEGLATRLWWLLGSSARASWAEPGSLASLNRGLSILTPARSSSLQPHSYRIGGHHHV